MAKIHLPATLRNLLFSFVPLDQLVDWHDQQQLLPVFRNGLEFTFVDDQAHYFSFSNCRQIISMRYDATLDEIKEYYDPYTRHAADKNISTNGEYIDANGEKVILFSPLQMIVKFGVYYREVCETSSLHIDKEIALMLAIENEQPRLVWYYCQYNTNVSLPMIVAAIKSGNAHSLAIVLAKRTLNSEIKTLDSDNIIGLRFNQKTAIVMLKYKNSMYGANDLHEYLCGAGFAVPLRQNDTIDKSYFLLGAYYHNRINLARLIMELFPPSMRLPPYFNTIIRLMLQNFDSNVIIILEGIREVTDASYNELSSLIDLVCNDSLPVIFTQDHVNGAKLLLPWFIKLKPTDAVTMYISMCKIITGADLIATDTTFFINDELAYLFGRTNVRAVLHDRWIRQHVTTVILEPANYLPLISSNILLRINLWCANQQRYPTLMAKLWPSLTEV